MHAYNEYEMQPVLQSRFIVLLNNSPAANLNRLRMRLRDDYEVFYIYRDHNCPSVRQVLDQIYHAKITGQPMGYKKVIVLFDLESKPVIVSAIEDEFEGLKELLADEVQQLGPIEFEKKYCEHSIFMFGQCMCNNYFPGQYLADVEAFINGPQHQ